MAIALSELVVASTADEILALELSIGVSLGLPVTAWQPLGVGVTILETNAQVAAIESQSIALIAQGGYLSTSARMKDIDGNEITTWEDLVSTEVYNVQRIPATFASDDGTGVTVTNTSGTTYNFGVGEFHVSNSTTGATYNNSAAVSFVPGATAMPTIADAAGSFYTSGPGAIDNVVTARVGLTVTNSASLVGSDAETNLPLEARCQAKLGALSPNGPSQAYYFVATSILDSTQPFYNPLLSAPITHVTTVVAPALVNVYIANADGAPDPGDVTIVDDAIQAWVVPLGTTAIVQAAGEVTIDITYHLYVPSTAGVTAPQALTLVSDALATYISSIPIGGVEDASPNVVPWSGILKTIMDAVDGATAATLTVPAGDTTSAVTEVPVLGTISGTVTIT